MASGSATAHMREWYAGNRQGGGRSGASSRGGRARNSNLERAERVARSGGSSGDVLSAMYGLPF